MRGSLACVSPLVSESYARAELAEIVKLFGCHFLGVRISMIYSDDFDMTNVYLQESLHTKHFVSVTPL